MNKVNVNELKFVAYLRKSTDREDKQIQSLETQLNEVKRLALLQGFKIVEIVSESKSAKKQGSREGFNYMVESITKGKFNAIVTVAPDRLSRNAVDAGVIIELLTDRLIKHIATSTGSYEPTPNSVMMLQFFMMNAKLDNMVKAEKVTGGLATRIQNGWYPCVAPQGYLNTKVLGKGNNIILKDPIRFDQIRKLWDLMLTGSYTINELVEIADKQWHYKSIKRTKIGGTPISRSGLYEIFSNPFYYGYFNYNGELYKGAHPKMIEKHEFDKVQEILGRTNKRRPKTHVHIFTGLIKCSECGCSITATHKDKFYPKTNNYRSYDYYHCSRRNRAIKCNQPYLTEKQLSTQVVDILSSIEIPEDFKNWAKTYLIEKSKYEALSSMAILESQQKEYKEVERQLTELLDMRVSKEITALEYSTKKKNLEEVRDLLKEALESSEKHRDQFKKEIEVVFDFACSAREKMENGSIAEKREILANLGQNLLLKDGILCIELKKPFLVFKESKNPEYLKNKRLEPVGFVDTKVKYGVSEPKDVAWLPRVDSNHRP